MDRNSDLIFLHLDALKLFVVSELAFAKILDGTQKIEEKDEDNINMIEDNSSNPNDYLLKQNDSNQKGKQQKKEYTPIKSYKPSGNLVYDDDILNKIENKFL